MADPKHSSGARKMRRVITILSVILLVFLSLTTVQAQVPFTPYTSEPLSESWRWRPIEMLSAKGVRSMVGDSAGNMWFGLDKGIIRYDGYHWETFSDREYLGYPVGVLFQTSGDSIFAGSEAGLLQYVKGEWVKVFPSEDSINIHVTCMKQLPDGTLLAGIQDGLLLFRDRAFTILTVHSKVNFFRQAHPEASIVILPDELLFQRNFGRVDDIFLAEDGLIWLFMSRNNDGKLLQFSLTDTLHGVLRNYTLSDELGGLPLANRNQMLQAGDGTTWLINGFYKSGIMKKKGAAWEPLRLSDKFGGDELHTSIMETSDGSVWIGGLGRFFVYKEGRWEVYSSSALPIPSSRILLYESRDGNIWVAGVQGDVFRLSYGQAKWTKFRGLNFQFTDPLGRDWFISAGGRAVFSENGQWFAYGQPEGLIDAPVKLICTRDGSIWAAGSHAGVAATAHLKGEMWEIHLHPDLSWGIDPRSVFQDRNGSLWFGASVDRQEALGQVSGVMQLVNPEGEIPEWKHHTQREGIGQHNVYGIGQSPDGDMWLGGTNLLRYDGSRWRTIPGNEYFNDFVDIVYSARDLWVGSRYYGLFRFNGIRWKHFTNNHGLPSNTIISVFEESPNSVWVVTDKDIARYDGNAWYAGILPAELRIPREGGEITMAADGSIWVNKALREWKRRAFPFSTTPEEAFDEFWTIRYIRETQPPKTIINLYTESIDHSGNTLIGWTGSDFWEETPRSKLNYSYRLNEGEWSPFTTETSLVLTNLKDGRHTFEVRARDLDFNVERVPARITFSVRPPIWKQSWFILLVVSFLIVISIYETRLIKRNKRLSKLNVSLREANETLATRQNEIELQKEKILYQKEELEKKTISLEEKNSEIIKQRDQLSEMVAKVEELSRVKLRFFTNISHEFRTPLTLILGSIEQLLSAKDNDAARLTRAYEIIQRNSRRILRLINQILEIRKIETGKLNLNATTGDIVHFSDEIVKLFRDLARNMEVSLTFDPDRPSLPTKFDHDKIEKVLFNLLSNAFKSTPPGGSIRVCMETVLPPVSGDIVSSTANDDDEAIARSIPAQGGPGTIRIIVEDTGKGIPASELEHIFDRFYQVDESSRHQRYDSSGIGLSYVRDLVAIHNGYIGVESESGRGTRFILEIPYISPADTSAEGAYFLDYDPAELISEDVRFEVQSMGRIFSQIIETDRTAEQMEPGEEPAGVGLLALVVEDEYELRKFIRKILEPDYKVIEAVNGMEGYDKAVATQPDIIITDVMMPEMDGNELCLKLKNNLATNHIPVVMLTAKAAPENKIQGYQTGADAYIEKPFNTEFLKIRINNLMHAQFKIREKILRDLITQPSEIVVHSENDKMLRKMQEVLEKNISDSAFDVESLSQQFFLSRCHFSRKVKQITGLSPKEIIDSYRLKRAGQLLQQQKLSVSEIAYMVGFEHPNSFTRAFRKFYNMTPTEFASQN